MPKNIVIAEGGQGRTLTGVKKLTTKLQGGNTCRWVPEDEVGDYVRLSAKTIRENGEYYAADENYTGYKSVKVNVRPNTSSKSITVNGTYTAVDEGIDGYSRVTVNVPTGGANPKLGTKTIKSEGTYKAKSDGFDGYSTVTVKIKSATVADNVGKMYDYLSGGVMSCRIGTMTGGV